MRVLGGKLGVDFHGLKKITWGVFNEPESYSHSYKNSWKTLSRSRASNQVFAENHQGMD